MIYYNWNFYIICHDFTGNCPKDTCQGDHLCLKLLSYTDGSATKCYCPAGKLQLANGTCAGLSNALTGTLLHIGSKKYVDQ